MKELFADYIAYLREEALAQKYEQGFKRGFKRGFKQGFEQGFEQGVKQGVKQVRQTAANRMASRGVAIEDIADYLRVDQATVETLLNEKP